MASNFLYSTRDHKFIFKEWLNLEKVLSFPCYKGYYDINDVDSILDQALKVAKEILAPTNDDGDTYGVTLADGKVTLPPSFQRVYKLMQELGWGMHDPEEEGVMPEIIREACIEYFKGANPSFVPYFGLGMGAAELIGSFGRDEDKQKYLPNMHEGKWLGTMCLTEPNAGSDVGDALTKAYATSDPVIYKIKGTKIFITGGDQDLTENIIHLLLARVEGAALGTKGLSLFIVPKLWVNDDGSLEPNDVTPVAVEHKLGLKGSATCMLSFGDEGSCRGILLGNPPNEKGAGEGMAQMFQMMNGARHGAGQNALALSTVAYNNAVEYAKIRVQGRAITNPGGPRTRIMDHEDVRRMLLSQKATIEAMRALIFMNVYYQELAFNSPDEAERTMAARRMDVLNPLCKAYCTDMAWGLIADAIQVYGGYGYSEEYPVAKQARDVKIYSIWEGTNFIQSMDLVGRKWQLDKGTLFQDWLNEVEGDIDKGQNTSGLEEEYAILKEALNSYKEIYNITRQYYSSNLHLVPFYSTRVLHSTAMLYCGKVIAEQAIIAQNRMTELGKDHYDYPFYQGKVLSARYYIKNVVPTINNLLEVIRKGDTSAIDMPEEAF